MEIKLINEELIQGLRKEAQASERLRWNLDFRTSPEDGSQRTLNVLEPGTHVPIHRHTKTSESVVCIEGCLEWVFYEDTQNENCGEPVHDVEIATDESCFKEIARFRVCPREKVYGIQVPMMMWHTVEVYEPSAIFEAKDGKYVAGK